jgi:chromosome segregation ATPase
MIPIQHMTDREILISVATKVDLINAQHDRLNERLSAGDRRFSEHDSKIQNLDRDITELRGQISRIALPTDQRLEDLSQQMGKLQKVVDDLQKTFLIDGEDGKAISLREVFIRQQRTNDRMKQLIAAAVAAAPILSFVLERAAQVLWSTP